VAGSAEFSRAGRQLSWHLIGNFRDQTEAVMERLYFTCPTTRQDVDVGIETELETLLRIRNKRVFARCPLCDERHEWRVGDAQLQQAA
jgi:hypothetical protein